MSHICLTPKPLQDTELNVLILEKTLIFVTDTNPLILAKLGFPSFVF